MEGNKDFIKASANGQYEKVLQLLSAGADINAQDGYGRTALYCASGNGRYDVCQILLQRGADSNITENRTGNTPLIVATWNMEIEIVRLLLLNVANVNIQNRNQETALFTASIKGHYGICVALLQHGADPNVVRPSDGWGPLHVATSNQKLEIIELLLSNGADINLLTKDTKQTSLDLAKEDDYRVIIQTLERYPLYEAAKKGQFGKCKVLLQKGFSVHSNAHDEYNAMKGAIEGGHVHIAKLLIRNEVKSSNEIIYLATEKGLTEMVSLLLDEGEDPNSMHNGDGLIHVATRIGHVQLVLILLQRGADVNLKNEVGYTSLHIAATNGDEDIVTTLMLYEVNINSVTPKRETALYLACLNGQNNIVDILLRNGSHINVTNEDQKRALDLVMANEKRYLKITNALEQLMSSEVTESANKGLAYKQGHLCSGSDISISNATLSYLFVPDRAEFTQSSAVLEPLDIECLESKMVELTAIIFEINEFALDLEQLELETANESATVANLKRKIANQGLKRLKIKQSTEQTKFEDTTTTLFEQKLEDAKRKEDELKIDLEKLQTNLRDLLNKKKSIYMGIGGIIKIEL